MIYSAYLFFRFFVVFVLGFFFLGFHISEEGEETFLVDFFSNSSGLSGLFVLLFLLNNLLGGVLALLPFNFSAFSLQTVTFVLHGELLDDNVVFEAFIRSEGELQSKIVGLGGVFRKNNFDLL